MSADSMDQEQQYSGWWREIEAGSADFSKPYLMRHGFSSNLFSEADVLEMLRAMAAAPREQVNLRVYIDAGLRHDQEIHVLRNPPGQRETLDEWVRRVFGDARFCIALNNAEKFVDSLTRRCARVYGGYLAEHSMPAGGVDMGIFMGNYRWTPFGIHHDGDGVSILHFHLGPNNKQLWMWDNEKFHALTGSADAHFAPEDLLGEGIGYRLEPGSVFYMPSLYHIGENEGFSVDLTFGVSHLSPAEAVNRALGQAGRYLVSSTATGSGYADILDLATRSLVNPMLEGVAVDDWVRDAIIDYDLSLKSNGGFESPPLHAAEEGLIEDDALFRTVDPFKLHWRELSDKKLAVFARKNRLVVPLVPELAALFEQLNGGASVSVADLMAAPLGQRWSRSAIATLVSSLVAVKALEPIG